VIAPQIRVHRTEEDRAQRRAGAYGQPLDQSNAVHVGQRVIDQRECERLALPLRLDDR